MPALRKTILSLGLVVAAAPAAAQDGPPLPPERPPELSRPDAGAAVPLPLDRPRDLQAAQPQEPDVQRPASEQAAVPPPPDDPECLDRLARLGATAKPLPPIAEGSCGAPSPVQLSGLPDGVNVQPPIILTCQAAEALALWSRDVVSVAAEKELAAPLTKVAIGTSYQCRSQNHQAGARLSEHAYANGVDVSGFEFLKRAAVTVGKADPEGPDGRFSDAVRTGACRFFTTVLGPGTDAEHADHLHLDLRDRKKGYRICQ